MLMCGGDKESERTSVCERKIDGERERNSEGVDEKDTSLLLNGNSSSANPVIFTLWNIH